MPSHFWTHICSFLGHMVMLGLLVGILTFSFDGEWTGFQRRNKYFHQQCEIHPTFGTIRISSSFSNLMGVWGNSMYFQFGFLKSRLFHRWPGHFIFCLMNCPIYQFFYCTVQSFSYWLMCFDSVFQQLLLQIFHITVTPCHHH